MTDAEVVPRDEIPSVPDLDTAKSIFGGLYEVSEAGRKIRRRGREYVRERGNRGRQEEEEEEVYANTIASKLSSLY